jgi:hypothetical protein
VAAARSLSNLIRMSSTIKGIGSLFSIYISKPCKPQGQIELVRSTIAHAFHMDNFLVTASNAHDNRLTFIVIFSTDTFEGSARDLIKKC